MIRVDVAVQSYKKPESLIYTLLSLKETSGDLIDTIYICDDKSNDGTIDYYLNERFKDRMWPIKLKIRENIKQGAYSYTLMTREIFSKYTIIQKIRTLMLMPVKRLRWISTSDDIRYQWAINNTDKRFLFICHDDIKFNCNVIQKYLDSMMLNENMAIVGDMGECPLCPYYPCSKHDCQSNILMGKYPCIEWPIVGRRTILHRALGRPNRSCRINEWSCLINIPVARYMYEKYGACFGNYEWGGM